MCRECYLLHKREEAKDRYRRQGRYMYKNECVACGAMFTAWRKQSDICSECRKLMQNRLRATNNYIYVPGNYKDGIWEHRRIAERVIGRKLKTHEVIHHVDCNPENNVLDNLIVLSRSTHGKLHMFLDRQRVIIERSMNENRENCWKTLIAPMTTTWLETAGVKVTKLSEIGQSAGEPLSLLDKGKLQRPCARSPNKEC